MELSDPAPLSETGRPGEELEGVSITLLTSFLLVLRGPITKHTSFYSVSIGMER